MVANVRRIVTSAAKTVDGVHVQSIVEPGDTGDGNLQRIEQVLSVGDGSAGAGMLVVIAIVYVSPFVVNVEDRGREGSAGRVKSQGIVDADEEILF